MWSALRGIYRVAMPIIPDRIGIQLHALRAFGRLLDIDNGQSFSEKCQRRKLAREQHARYAALADKLAVKRFVADRVGAGYVTPTLWSGVRLPAAPDPSWPAHIVVKANHGSGTNLFVNTANANWSETERESRTWLLSSHAPSMKERWYELIPRRLLVEPNITESDEEPLNYRFFVFHGRVEFIQLDLYPNTERARRAMYSRDWVLLPFTTKRRREPTPQPPPRHLESMVAAAEALGAEFDFVRVDLYDLADGPRFGEMTFAPGSGFSPFDPPAYDLEIGRLWRFGEMGS